ncbi:hypothetical protein ACFLZ7_03795 [Nanoarchaeota archaeon]
MRRSETLARKARLEAAKEMKVGKVHTSGGGNFGLFVLLVGLVWLAVEQGWIPSGWPIWPIIVIIVGLWLMMGRKKH